MDKRRHVVEWAKEISTYPKCLNNEKIEDLGWMSPFEIYFGRKSNELVSADMNVDGHITTENRENRESIRQD